MSQEFYVFGSVARGDASVGSDVDILVVPDDGQQAASYPASWSVYRRQTIREYYESGRLFAWHLHLESKCIFSPLRQPWLASLGEPSRYASARQDVEHLWQLLAESIEELRRGTDSLVYELGISYTALRDIAMSASWAWLGRPNFSRMVPYELPVECPLGAEAYRVAMAARHASARGAGIPGGAVAAAHSVMVAPLDGWVGRLLERL